jgi:hypothetical protein
LVVTVTSPVCFVRVPLAPVFDESGHQFAGVVVVVLVAVVGSVVAIVVLVDVDGVAVTVTVCVTVLVTGLAVTVVVTGGLASPSTFTSIASSRHFMYCSTCACDGFDWVGHTVTAAYATLPPATNATTATTTATVRPGRRKMRVKA